VNPSKLQPEMTAQTRPLTLPTATALRRGVLVLGLLLALTVWLFRHRVRSHILERGTLANDSPTVDLVEEMIETSPHPHAALLSAWNTGKIVHRLVAIREVKRIVASSKLLPPEFESLVFAAALDADNNVREAALSILRLCQHPALVPMAAAQLRDCDPELRLLGLDYVKRMSAGMGIPIVVPLLDDSDPFVAVKGLKVLEQWTHQNFGVKLTEIATSVEGDKSGLRDLREGGQTRSRESANRAKAWWGEHRSEFAPVPRDPSVAPSTGLNRAVAGDFELPALDGHRVRLSDYRAKVVLLHFWTTWNPACVCGAQDLVTLQKNEGSRLTVIGVSLDNVPDPHGHLGPHEAGEHHADHDHDHDRPSLSEVREKVAHAVRDNLINYTVLIDEDFSVGGRFNSGELPTTIIIDAEGFIRRRFAGRRTLPVLEAMLAEASQPMHSSLPNLDRSSH